MGIKVGINGFGRIGRVVFRTCMENPDIEVTALNDPAINVDYITYLIKFDSTHGKFKGSVINNQDEVIVNGMRIKVFSEELPESIPWDSAAVRYVVEASGMFTSHDKASGHLCSQSVKRVIVAAPSADVPMIVIGVNHKKMTSDLSVVSGASSTLYCLAPIIKVLDDNFGVSEGFVTSIHAMTPSLKPLDGLCMRGRHWRDHRSIHQNIIPANTGACKALGKILPRIKDKLAGIAFRVPIVDVSALDITVRLTVNTSLQSIIKSVEQASSSNMKRIIKTSNEGAVSSDFIGDSFSCILDVESCIQLRPNFYKLICWYENEYSYANRIVNTISLSEDIFLGPVKTTKLVKLKRPYRGKGEPSGEASDEFITSTSSRGMSKRCLSPDHSPGQRPKKKTDTLKMWNDPSAAKPNLSAPVKQTKAGFLHNLVSVTTPTTAAKLSPECLKKLNRDFSKPSKVPDAAEPKTPQRSPERSDTSDAKTCKMNKSTKDRQRVCKQRKIVSTVPPDKCDNIQMAAVLRDMPSEPKSSSSQCLDINRNRDRNVQTDKCCGFGKVSSDCNVNMAKNETSHKMPIMGKLVSQKNEMKIDQNIVTEIETHPIRSMPPTSETPVHKIESTTDETVSQSDVLDDTLAKTIDLFVDGLTHEQILQRLIDENGSKTSTQPSGTDDSPPPSKREQALAERICDMADLVRFVDIPRREIRRSEKRDCTKGQQHSPGTKESSTICETSETSMSLEGEGSKRSTLIIDMQQQYDGPETECENRSDDDHTLSDSEPAERHSSRHHSRTRHRKDIYDKVESTSVTDSENSFYVRERKSEVIQLTDLTRGTSLDDLVKLDKICRIMEISDELSDKLFQALPKADASGMKEKWSFKELCEKIKFDEFCEAVFDK